MRLRRVGLQAMRATLGAVSTQSTITREREDGHLPTMGVAACRFRKTGWTTSCQANTL